MEAVEPLEKNGTSLIPILRPNPLTTAVSEFVTKVKPFSLHENFKSLERISKINLNKKSV